MGAHLSERARNTHCLFGGARWAGENEEGRAG